MIILIYLLVVTKNLKLVVVNLIMQLISEMNQTYQGQQKFINFTSNDSQ